jgi:hypothetical protein
MHPYGGVFKESFQINVFIEVSFQLVLVVCVHIHGGWVENYVMITGVRIKFITSCA